MLENGVEAVVDQYDVPLGGRLPQFMESIFEADYMLIICTPMYKNKADNRTSGAGDESRIISEEMYRKHNESKFIPILRNGTFDNAMRRFCAGKLGVDLSQNPYSEEEYKNLLATIFGKKETASKEKIRN